ncbi:hypothetical protein AGDE_14728 [Angomonas deanei]|uniref:Uncharacterized protein n=1 Tax=Angomonas deanei TaxID=59799 RepID=A0A7G2C068_9TRYP|nr:hypothetical protein AGDE_14728 [Angomonas deanei]CAD2213046.1 hypothetical protein, conserved [Angomonas deanei]|eukprot:EPY20349.1 hypothetical protein AGDE_14728 [Angomonas deanei]
MRDVKVYIVTSCHHNSAVPGIAEYLQGMIAENVESLMANICDINQLTKMNLRSQPHILIFIMGISDIDELTLEGSSFSRLLRQVTTPKDILHHVRYTVLSVLETNGSSFLAGRQMDNRLEEFGRLPVLRSR